MVRMIRVMEQIIALWPRVKTIADDLGLKYTTVHSWVLRKRIPAAYDLALIRAAKKRGKTLTLEQLARARASQKRKDAA